MKHGESEQSTTSAPTSPGTRARTKHQRKIAGEKEDYGKNNKGERHWEEQPRGKRKLS